MNKYESAIENINVCLPGDDYLLEIEILQELVERATPKKVIIEDNYDIIAEWCPSCRQKDIFVSIVPEYNFCPHCGQALDWNDTN